MLIGRCYVLRVLGICLRKGLDCHDAYNAAKTFGAQVFEDSVLESK